MKDISNFFFKTRTGITVLVILGLSTCGGASVIFDRDDTSGESWTSNFKDAVEQAYTEGRSDEAIAQEAATTAKAEVADQVFGNTLDSALLAEVTELDNLRTSAGQMLTEAERCRAQRWYDRALQLQQEQGINPAHYLDTELKARQGQLREKQVSFGDLRMTADQFSEVYVLMAEVKALGEAIAKLKEDWMPVDATGEERPAVDISCRASTYATDGAVSDYLFQVGARREIENREQSLTEEVNNDG